jgi:hypothetical protein
MWAVVNAVMKIRIPLNEGTFCTRQGTIRYSRKNEVLLKKDSAP